MIKAETNLIGIIVGVAFTIAMGAYENNLKKKRRKQKEEAEAADKMAEAGDNPYDFKKEEQPAKGSRMNFVDEFIADVINIDKELKWEDELDAVDEQLEAEKNKKREKKEAKKRRVAEVYVEKEIEETKVNVLDSQVSALDNLNGYESRAIEAVSIEAFGGEIGDAITSSEISDVVEKDKKQEGIKSRIKSNPKDIILFSEILKPKYQNF